jgi:hypothetical protein
MKKYAVYPGYIVSKNDHDRHYISFDELCRLYKVNPAECVNTAFSPGIRHESLIKLEPRYDGNYELPTNEIEDREAK